MRIISNIPLQEIINQSKREKLNTKEATEQLNTLHTGYFLTFSTIKTCQQLSYEGASKYEILTHLHEKTNEEVESSHGDKQHFKIHIQEVVQL